MMGQNSAIEWTDHTFSPWIGCTRVSDGCRNCYAERIAARFKLAQWGPHPRRPARPDAWEQPIKWNDKAARTGNRARVFCGSMMDVFDAHPDITPDTRRRLGITIDDTPHLLWLLLTKRPENIPWLLPRMFPFGAPPNVRIGVSVEDQATADERIPALLRHWEGQNFISYEPALGPVDFARWLCEGWRGALSSYFDRALGRRVADIDGLPVDGLDWVVAGAESGPGARPAHPEWFRAARDQCQAAGVPYFFKQWGEWAPDCLHRALSDRRECKTTPRPAPGKMGVMFRCGKRNAGRLLDGREWNEFPEDAQ